MPTVISGSASAEFNTALPQAQVANLVAEQVPPVFARVVRTAGTITTTSTSLVDVTGATVTFTTGAFPVAYGAAQSSRHGTGGGAVYFNIDVDGTIQHGTEGVFFEQSTIDYSFVASFGGQTAALTAASHTIKEQWRVNLGTGTIRASTANNHMFYAMEIR